MKKNLKNKRVVLMIIIIAVILIIGIIIGKIIEKNIKTSKINQLDKESYSLQYDNTWKIENQEESKIELVHKKSQSKLYIIIKELTGETQYKSIDEIFDNMLYNIEEKNKDYKLIYIDKTKITKHNIDGYKVLFEENDSQACIYMYKQGNRVVTFTYEATYDNFDIILDSVNNIVYNFNLNEQKFDVQTNINLETSQITYSEQEDVKNMLTETTDCSIAASNYQVNYSIPNNFKFTEYNSSFGSYLFEGLPSNSTIKLNTNIYNMNIFDYLNRDNILNIYSTNLNSYNQASEVLDKFLEEPVSYIYKNNYLSNNKIVENIKIAFVLNKNHIFVASLSSYGVGIPKELVEMIKVNNFKNIASNIKIEKQNRIFNW